jgi:hypothetical protein
MKPPQTIWSSVPGRLPAGSPPEGPRSLLACFLDIVADWEALFPQARTYRRAVRQALGTLICLGRRTLSRIIWTNGGAHKDPRADYFLFARCRWDASQLFTSIVQRALPWCQGRYVGIAIDDTRLRKTGPRIQQAFYQRDPLSPKFYMNLMFGLRFLQASLLVPLFRQAKVGTRALPIAFEEVSVVKHPRRKLPQRKGSKAKRNEPLELEWKQYRAAQKIHNLSTRFADLMHRLRATFDACGAAKKILLLAVDGSFCNRTVFTTVIQGVELIARARKDIRLCFRAQDGPRRFYGLQKLTPEQVRLDDSRPWKATTVFYGGKRRKVEYKEVAGIFWQGGARKRPLRLLVVRPTRYRKRKSGRYYYRQPAYLLTTVVKGTVRQLLQIYFDRWQIEVNHREEKDTLGVGQAQLRNFTSVPKQPALAVASYSALLLASLQAFGALRGEAYAALPKWRRRAVRPSALDLIALLRKEMVENAGLVEHLGLYPTDRALTAAAAT